MSHYVFLVDMERMKLKAFVGADLPTDGVNVYCLKCNTQRIIHRPHFSEQGNFTPDNNVVYHGK